MTMNAPELLAAALAERVQQETAPVREAIRMVEVCCASFSQIYASAIERRVLGAMLRAAGTDVPLDDPALATATNTLVFAMVSLEALLSSQPPSSPRVPPSGPQDPAPEPPPQGYLPPESAADRDASEAILASDHGRPLLSLVPPVPPCGDRLIGPPPEADPVMPALPSPPVELELVEEPCAPAVPEPKLASRESGVHQRFDVDPDDLKKAREISLQAHEIDFCYDHPSHIVHVMQVCVAQCRGLMDRLPPNSAAHSDMVKVLKFLTAKKAAHSITPFIMGLSQKHDQDWDRLARDAVASLQRYERDMKDGLGDKPASKPVSKPAAKKERQEVATNFSWPELPALRKEIALGREAIIVGGVVEKEKIRVIKERFGLDVTWYGTDPNRPRKIEDVVNRIKGGRICCVVIINGWIRHKVYASLVAACDSMRVPYANGEKGGIACIGSAIDKIEEAFARMAAA